MGQAAWELAAGCGGHCGVTPAQSQITAGPIWRRAGGCSSACQAVLHVLPCSASLPPTTSAAQIPFPHTWQDSPGMGLENMTANAPGSQSGNSERRMLRVVSCVPRGVACMALSRRVRSMMASYLQVVRGVQERVQEAAGGAGQAGLWLAGGEKLVGRSCGVMGQSPSRNAGQATCTQSTTLHDGSRQRFSCSLLPTRCSQHHSGSPLQRRVGADGGHHAAAEQAVHRPVQRLRIDGRVVGWR